MGYALPDARSTPESSRPTTELRAAERIVLMDEVGSIFWPDNSTDDPDLRRLLDARAMLGDKATYRDVVILAASWIIADEMMLDRR